MKKIESFQINHLLLQPGLYVSRRDKKNGVSVTTFDLRLTAPNREPVVDMPALHTIEHLGATFLRSPELNPDFADVVYFGPMGCRTGCYLVLFGEKNPEDVLGTILNMCDFVIDFEGEIPGAKAIECGNYLEQNLNMAKYYIKRWKRALVEDKNFVYPQ